MKKRIISMGLALSLIAGMLVGCGGSKSSADAVSEEAVTETAEAATEATEETKTESGDKEVLQFYHAYFHDEATWLVAPLMRQIYQEFAMHMQMDRLPLKQLPLKMF